MLRLIALLLFGVIRQFSNIYDRNFKHVGKSFACKAKMKATFIDLRNTLSKGKCEWIEYRAKAEYNIKCENQK